MESLACESENVFHHLSNLAQIKILLEAVENKSVSFLFIHLAWIKILKGIMDKEGVLVGRVFQEESTEGEEAFLIVLSFEANI